MGPLVIADGLVVIAQAAGSRDKNPLLGLIDVVVGAVVVVREELLTDIEARVAITGEIGAQGDLKLCESKAGEGLRDVGVEI